MEGARSTAGVEGAVQGRKDGCNPDAIGDKTLHFPAGDSDGLPWALVKGENQAQRARQSPKGTHVPKEAIGNSSIRFIFTHL